MGGQASSLLLKKPLQTDIEKRMVEALAERSKKRQFTHKSFTSIILKFPSIDESFEAVRNVFKKFVREGKGLIHLQELKNCLEELQVNLTHEEVKKVYQESDFDGNQGIDFKEFIVVLALVYFLGRPGEGSSRARPSRLGLPRLEASFETIVEAFVMLDSNGDGYLSKQEVIESINETSPGKNTDRTSIRRFEEMDWDHNGLVTFKEFLFSFIDWVGVEEDEDDRGTR
jgi:calcium-binding protein CML